MSTCKRCGRITLSTNYGKDKDKLIVCRKCRKSFNKCDQCGKVIKPKSKRKNKEPLCKSCIHLNRYKNKENLNEKAS